MLIVNQLLGDVDKVLFSQQARDEACQPYLMLRNELKKFGIDFEALKEQSIENIDFIIYWDADSIPPKNIIKNIYFKIRMLRSNGSLRDINLEGKEKNKEIKKILFLYEPYSFSRCNKNSKIHQEMDLIFTWKKDLVDNIKYFRVYLPSSKLTSEEESYSLVKFEKKKLLVDISSNKKLLGQESSSEFRMQEIQYIDANFEKDFCLYGPGWNQKISIKEIVTLSFLKKFYIKIKCYRGISPSKKITLRNYKFILCYENTFSEQGFISIKIFDALRLGCVPIYMGAPDILDYVPSNCFIDRRLFKNTKDLILFLQDVTEEEHNNYLKAAKVFIDSENYDKFSPEFFATNFIEVFKKKFNIQFPSLNQ